MSAPERAGGGRRTRTGHRPGAVRSGITRRATTRTTSHFLWAASAMEGPQRGRRRMPRKARQPGDGRDDGRPMPFLWWRVRRCWRRVTNAHRPPRLGARRAGAPAASCTEGEAGTTRAAAACRRGRRTSRSAERSSPTDRISATRRCPSCWPLAEHGRRRAVRSRRAARGEIRQEEGIAARDCNWRTLHLLLYRMRDLVSDTEPAERGIICCARPRGRRARGGRAAEAGDVSTVMDLAAEIRIAGRPRAEAGARAQKRCSTWRSSRPGAKSPGRGDVTLEGVGVPMRPRLWPAAAPPLVGGRGVLMVRRAAGLDGPKSRI